MRCSMRASWVHTVRVEGSDCRAAASWRVVVVQATSPSRLGMRPGHTMHQRVISGSTRGAVPLPGRARCGGKGGGVLSAARAQGPAGRPARVGGAQHQRGGGGVASACNVTVDGLRRRSAKGCGVQWLQGLGTPQEWAGGRKQELPLEGRGWACTR